MRMPKSRKDLGDRDIFETSCPKLSIKTFSLYQSQTAGHLPQVASGGQSPGEPSHFLPMVCRGLGAAQRDITGDSEVCHGYAESQTHLAPTK